MEKFDPSTSISADFGIFGLPCTEQEAKVILIPVPWEVTTSYGRGASLGPALIRQASEQVDLYDFETEKAYEAGYFMLPYPDHLKKLNDEYKKKAQQLIELKNNLSKDRLLMNRLTEEVNKTCNEMSEWVYRICKHYLSEKKLVGLVGGDHSTPLGLIRVISEKYKGDFGVLHIDAHADLREAYQGFTQSHASIMHNVMTSEWKPKKLVQVGIRDFCEDEFKMIESRADITTFFDIALKRDLAKGETWHHLCQKIISELPENVYISFDIDGLDPAFCPQTGTPVPGGLSLDQIFYLFFQLRQNGRKVIGFDLNEVSTGGLPLEEANEWDGNVGARVLYKLCGWMVTSQEEAR